MKKLALVMLFGGLSRFRAFAKERLTEAISTGLFREIVFVINNTTANQERMIVEEVKEFDEFKALKALIFNPENNIPQGRNFGIRLVETELVFIWDDDDKLINPQALREAAEFCSFHDLPIMEVPMVFPSGKLFHPGRAEVMPQIESGLPDLKLIGMMHSPYFLKKEAWGRIPIPEYVPLRGDWLHWSALLWEAGIPITCWTKTPVVMEGVRSRENGSTASGNGPEAKFQAYTSIIALFAIYSRLTGEDRESLLVRHRYFKKFCEGDEVWFSLVGAGKTLQQKENAVDDSNIVIKAKNVVRQRLSGVHLKKMALKPYEAVMEPNIARAIFQQSRE